MISSQALKEGDAPLLTTPVTEAVPAEVEEELRECTPVTLTLCSHLPYNSTSYPNLVGHVSKDVILRDLVAFRELLDAECSRLAQVSNILHLIDESVRSELKDKYFKYVPNENYKAD